jgi:DNA polymerase phi
VGGQVQGEERDAARGAELLLAATLLHQRCIDDADSDADVEALEVRSFRLSELSHFFLFSILYLYHPLIFSVPCSFLWLRVPDTDAGDPDRVQACVDGASRMFPVVEGKKGKKSRRSSTTGASSDADAPEPIDVLVDTVIGFLEKATAYMRAVANQVFSLLAGSAKESTIELILAVRLYD